MQKEEDLKGDDLKYYEAKIEAMNLILISIPNDIYNFVDACTTAQAMWQRIERLMRGTVQHKVDRETHFTNEFDQFVVEPGEALLSVYNRFAQLMNDLEQNGIKFSPVTVNTKFLSCLQPEWLKYVTQVHLAKRLTEDSYDDLFYYFNNLRNWLMHLEQRIWKNHMILLHWWHVWVPLPGLPRLTMSHILLQWFIRMRIIKGMQYKTLLMTTYDKVRVIITDEQNDFLFADASRMEELEE
nr:hypothetical protein [Tanacetum cinerariifolium]